MFLYGFGSVGGTAGIKATVITQEGRDKSFVAFNQS